MKEKTLLILLLAILLPLHAVSQTADSLKNRLNEIISGKKAQVGIAVIINGNDFITINNNIRYPMMSVMKFHQALAVAAKLQEQGKSLSSKIYIKKEELRPDTYSPLREKAPDGNISISVKELLEYTLQLSDNNACDILFNHIAGTRETDGYLRKLGIKDFAITATEAEMHDNLTRCYDNWTSPFDAAILMEKFLNSNFLSRKNKKFIYRTMTGCDTGQDRLVKPLKGKDVIIGHKTGSGPRNADGEIIAINDMGFVILPDGNRYTIAVFVKDSRETESDSAKIISDISEAVYNFVISDKDTKADDSL